MAAYIRFENLNKYFGQNHVLKGVDLDIEEGQLVTLLGPSGCGKSTMLRCLAGLETVSSGKIYLEGKDVTNVAAKDRGVGMVFQQYSLFPNMDVAKNVAFGLKLKKVPKNEIDTKVAEILEVVGLSEKSKQYPHQLSGGQMQRAALARALVTQPKVLLLDEPLSAIDALLRRNLQVEIRRIQKSLNMTAIFVTHDQEEAMVMSDKIHLMNEGVIEQSATTVDMYTKPATKFAATFIGHYNILSAEDFKKATGAAYDCSDVAIRPEVIEISQVEPQEPERVVFKGKVVFCLARGNVMRYTMDVNGVEMDVDALFRVSTLLKEGDTCYLSIKKDNILEL